MGILLMSVLMAATPPASDPARHVAETAITVKMPSAKPGYPGWETWGEIQPPHGKRTWSFAIFQGQDVWTIPVHAEAAGEYRLIRVERRQGEKREDTAFTGDTVIQSKAASPKAASMAPARNLVEAGEFKPFFAAQEPWCVNDHTLVQGPDGMWHLFGITHPKPLDFFKDPGKRLAHATASSLLQRPWEAQQPAVTADYDRYKEYLLWAPHVIRHEDKYYMFVCAGEKDNHRYRLHLLTSPDLKEWTRYPGNPVVTDGFDGRDPMVIREKDRWIMYYTATSTPDGGNYIVAAVTSSDLLHWGNRSVVFTHPRAGTFGGPTESPFVVRRGDQYYLFTCDNDWTDVYLSTDPLRWDIERTVGRIHAHASEIVRDADGQWYITHAGWMSGPVSMAPLKWHDDRDTSPTSVAPAAK